MTSQTTEAPLEHEFNEVAIASAVETERLRVFNERSIVGAVSAPAGIVLLTWVLWVAAGWRPAITWAVLMGAVELTIGLVALRCRRALNDGAAAVADVCKTAHFVLAGLAGVAWGSAAWFVWTEVNTSLYLATVTVVVGVAGIAMMTMASYRAATLLFFCGIYLTPLLHVVLHGGPVAQFLEAGLLIGLAVQLGYARELGRVVLRDAEQHARNAALLARLSELVTHDQLTGAYSRRHTFDQLEQLVATRQRHGTRASIVMFDLDHFKVVNDTYGHPTGDRALLEAVRAVKAALRNGEMLGRIGGEEFLVLLPMTDADAAFQLAERLRQTLAETSIADGTDTIFLPASFGVAELLAAESHAEWFRRVDGALYQAKAQGRNRVVVA